MTLEEIEKLSRELRVLAYYPEDYVLSDTVDKLLAVAKAAKYLMMNTDECGDSAFKDRQAMYSALEDLEKDS